MKVCRRQRALVRGTGLGMCLFAGALFGTACDTRDEGTRTPAAEDGSPLTLAQRCGQDPAEPNFGPFEEDTFVVLGRHTPVGGADNWSGEMSEYVGQTTRIVATAGVDHSGCAVVKVEADEEAYAWRVRDMAIHPGGRPTPAEGQTQEFADESARAVSIVAGWDFGATVVLQLETESVLEPETYVFSSGRRPDQLSAAMLEDAEPSPILPGQWQLVAESYDAFGQTQSLLRVVLPQLQPGVYGQPETSSEETPTVELSFFEEGNFQAPRVASSAKEGGWAAVDLRRTPRGDLVGELRARLVRPGQEAIEVRAGTLYLRSPPSS